MSYPTALSSYSTFCLEEEKSLAERAALLRRNVDALRLVGPTILVGHSMGGLLLKQMVVAADQSRDVAFLEQLAGLCFYSTPHRERGQKSTF